MNIVPYDDDLARQALLEIMQSPASAERKYDDLRKLDVEIQNNNTRGIASPVILDILRLQHMLIQQINNRRTP